MRIRILSDLHLEFTPFTLKPVKGVDVTVLAGDLAAHDPISQARLNIFFNQLKGPALYVPGNHEYYASHKPVEAVDQYLRFTYPRVRFMNRDAVEIQGVRFLGCTLWSDFNMVQHSQRRGERPLTPETAMRAAGLAIADYNQHVLSYDPVALATPETHRKWHQRDRAWLDKQITLAEEDKVPVVVVTHFLPHPACVNSQYFESVLNPYFCSDCSELFREPVKLWIHGHTHCPVDEVVNGIPIRCNPRGCTFLKLKKPENQYFNSTLVQELLCAK